MDHESSEKAMPQASEDEIGLSASSLAALAEFALDLGIDCGGPGGGPGDVRKAVQTHFDEVGGGKEDSFTFVFGDDVELELRGWRQDLGQTLSSTGLTLWAGAELLADFLWAHREPLGLTGHASVVELGAGLGLDGLLCAALGEGTVLLTDGDENALELLRDNADANGEAVGGCQVRCARLRWGEDEDLDGALGMLDSLDLVVAADVVYQEEAVLPLVATVRALLEAGSVSDGAPGWRRQLGPMFLLSFTRRGVPIDRLLDAAAGAGLQHRIVCQCAGSGGGAPVDEAGATGEEGERERAAREGSALLHLVPGDFPCGRCCTEPIFAFWKA